MNKEIHKIQAGILKVLLFKERAKFSELNTNKLSTDQLTFHLKKLLSMKVVEKVDDKFYSLTTHGKDYANRFDVDSGPEIKVEKQAKIGVLVVAKNGSTYLMQHRLKQPFFGFRGFITGKIKIGESVQETASRELQEETGFSGQCDLKAIYHERIYSSEGALLEDKYFYVFLAQNLKGDLISDVEGGRNEWISKKSILEGNIFYDIADILKLAEKKQLTFAEKSYVVEKF